MCTLLMLETHRLWEIRKSRSNRQNAYLDLFLYCGYMRCAEILPVWFIGEVWSTCEVFGVQWMWSLLSSNQHSNTPSWESGLQWNTELIMEAWHTVSFINQNKFNANTWIYPIYMLIIRPLEDVEFENSWVRCSGSLIFEKGYICQLRLV